LVDEIAAMERAPDPEQYSKFRKASLDYANFAQTGTRVTSASGVSEASRALVDRMIKSGAIPRARLVMIEGPTPGQVFPMAPEMDIGRTSASGLAIASPSVSRKHARIALLDGVFWIVDLGSSGGVFVNGRRVERHRLAHGDVIGIGQVKLRYEQLPPPN
ncbi:MAG TPA: FHA domain-containing protein, partial [Polyangia bacterium]|nr:FHA domain-containing protein [Polyangia bacterium]